MLLALWLTNITWLKKEKDPTKKRFSMLLSTLRFLLAH